MKTTATAVTIWRKRSTPRNWLPAIVRTSASTSSGSRPVQNFDHRNSRRPIGDVRMIQNAAPSADTAGNTKRTATVAITKPAMPRLRKIGRASCRERRRREGGEQPVKEKNGSVEEEEVSRMR